MVREAAQGGDTLAMEALGTLFSTYLRGKGSGDSYVLPGGQHPPLTSQDYFAQPRALTLAPNGNLMGPWLSYGGALSGLGLTKVGALRPWFDRGDALRPWLGSGDAVRTWFG